jgi:hypothetical protein
MNLIEAMVAAVVASIAVSGSAMVLAMGLRWSVRAEQQQDLHERQEAALLAAEATVRDAAAVAPRAGDCAEAAAELEAALSASGVALGLSRPGSGEAVLVTVAGGDGQPDRMRLFRPAALALCGPAPVTEVAPEAAGEETP